MSSKWRPNDGDNWYCIPDIHGNYDGLSRILNRILPLRKSEGIQDKIIFLGDYIDRGPKSKEVIDLLLQIKKDYPDESYFVKGNHEDLLLISIGVKPADEAKKNINFKISCQNGLYDTIRSYLYAKNVFDTFPTSLTQEQIKELIPIEHINFLENCKDYVQIDKFIFAHAGLQPGINLDKHLPEVFYWDRKLFEYCKNNIRNNKPLGWEDEHVIVTGHNGPSIIIHPNYLMLDCGSPKELLVMELNSRQIGTIKQGKKRLVISQTENTVLKKSPFSRVSN